MTKISSLFQPIQIRNLEIKNRIAFAPHGTGQTMDNLAEYYRARAEGGVGLVITSSMSVHRSYEVARTANVSHDDRIPGLKSLAKVAHHNDCRIFGQLFHPGGALQGLSEGARIPLWAPSDIPTERYHTMPAPMSQSMIREIISSYGDGARRFAEAGMDGIELLASHGYLVSQFFSPHANRREDEYGGSFENRIRFSCEILADIRRKVGASLVVGVRLSMNGLSGEDWNPTQTIKIVKTLTQLGLVDYVSLVYGAATTLEHAVHIAPPMAIPDSYLANQCSTVKHAADVPIFLAGRINEPYKAEQIVAGGHADVVCLGRALICDPYWPNKVRDDKIDDVRACIGCNQACIGHRYANAIVTCIQHPESGREIRFPHIKTKSALLKKVVVAGGGPAGMKAAAIAAERGHDVTIYEKSRDLGGQVLLAQALPGRSEFGGIVTNLTREMELSGVKIRKHVSIDRELIEQIKPDALIIATGAVPYRPEGEGLQEPNVVDAWAVIRGQTNLGNKVVIADWRCDWVGLGLAELAARKGSSVSLYCQGSMAGQNIPSQVRDIWVGILDDLGVEVKPYVRLFGADKNTAYFQHMTNGKPILCEDIDTLILAQGHRRDNSLISQLTNWGGETHIIGDALNPRTAEEAVLEGLEAAMKI